MTKTFTSIQNDIIRYVYDETEKSENPEIESLIAQSHENLDFYLDCLKIKQMMDSLVMKPRMSVVNRIMDYSKNYKPAV